MGVPPTIRSIGVLLVGLLGSLPPWAVAASPPPDSVATFEYGAGSVASGTIEGSCEAGGIVFARREPGAFDFTSRGGVLRHVVTEFNFTVLSPQGDDPAEVPLTAAQWFAEEAVPAGAGRIAWDHTGTVRVFGDHWGEGGEAHPGDAFPARFHTSQLRTGPPSSMIHHGSYLVQDRGTVTLWRGGIPGWNRLLDLTDGTVEANGNLTVYLESATVTVGDDFEDQVPERRENVTNVENPLVGYWRVRYHHALLQLDDAHLTLSGNASPLACGALQARLDGALVAYHASGTIEGGGSSIAFDRRELSLAGQFELDEAPKDLPREAAQTGRVAATGSGRFSAAGLDFQPVPVSSWWESPLVRVGFWSLLGVAVATAAAKLVGGLFTRLEKHRLADRTSRSLLLDALQAHPWAGPGELRRATGASRGTLRYHLDVLQRHGLILAHRVGLRTRYALPAHATTVPPPASTPVADAVGSWLSAQLRAGPQRLAALVGRLGEQRGYSRVGAWKVVRRAAERGWVVLDRRGREVWVRWAGASS